MIGATPKNPAISIAATEPPKHLTKRGRAVWRRLGPLADARVLERTGAPPCRSDLFGYELLCEDLALVEHVRESGRLLVAETEKRQRARGDLRPVRTDLFEAELLELDAAAREALGTFFIKPVDLVGLVRCR